MNSHMKGLPQRLLSAILAVLSCMPCVAQVTDREEFAARNAIVSFCGLEFAGSPDRVSSVVFTNESNAARLNGHAEIGFAAGALEIESDDITIVAWYRIRSVAVSGNTGSASVEYQKLGDLFGFGAYDERAKFTRDKRQIVENLKLVKRDGRWLVLDPPRAKVGRDPVVIIMMNTLANGEDLKQTTPQMLKQGKFARQLLDQVLSW